MKRKAFGKQDANQIAIVDTLRRLGISVAVEHDDILVGWRGFTYWFEIKRPDMVSKLTGEFYKNAIKPSQQKLLREWAGHYSIVTTVEEILEEIGFDTEVIHY